MIFLDFETFSEANLKEVGAYRYAEHPTTEVLCAAWAIDGDEVSVAVGNAAPGHVFDDHMIVAHNVEFEKQILKHKLGLDFSIDRFIDTAALAARMSLPRKLEDLAAFFQLDATAKLAANVGRAGDSVCRPRKPSKQNPARRWTPETKPEAFQALYARCQNDVEVTREVYRRLLPLSEIERELWELTIEMNERGILCDLASIPAAQEACRTEAEPLELEFELLVGEKIKSYVRVAQALGLDDVRKPTVRKALRDPATAPAVRRALQILQALSKSSVAKLDAMLARAHADGRVRGSFLYCGAERTNRWSASGIQPQNFKRGLAKETDTAFEALHAGALDLIFTGARRPPPDPSLTPTATVAEMMRGFLLGPFHVGDKAQIEARVLNWMAGQDDTVQLFATGGDPYCVMASRIYKKPINKKEHPAERFMGKQAVLGAGYGLGASGFQFMLDDIYDVQISEEFSKQVVAAYRSASPKVCKLWERMGRAFTFAVANKSKRIKLWPDPGTKPQLYFGVVEVGGKEYAYIELPSGRKMYYAEPELISTPRGPSVAYFGRDRFSKGWTRVRTYGGKLTENVTQAISRDALAEAALRLKAAGYEIVMMVHDEIVANQRGDLSEFKRIMEEQPKWAPGLPIEVEVFSTVRYRK